MDPRAITLAQLEFEAFNEQVRVRPRSRLNSGRQRPVANPSFPTQPLVRGVASIRSWTGFPHLRWLAGLGKQSI
jgi:hypothetical protein